MASIVLLFFLCFRLFSDCSPYLLNGFLTFSIVFLMFSSVFFYYFPYVSIDVLLFPLCCLLVFLLCSLRFLLSFYWDFVLIVCDVNRLALSSCPDSFLMKCSCQPVMWWTCLILHSCNSRNRMRVCFAISFCFPLVFYCFPYAVDWFSSISSCLLLFPYVLYCFSIYAFLALSALAARGLCS